MTKGTSLRVPQTSEMKAVLPTTVPLGVRLQRAYKRHWQLYVMLIPALVLLALFSVYPLWGIGIAFVDYNPFKGVLGSEYVGLGNFRDLFSQPSSWILFRNTLMIAVGKIVVGQFAAVVFALLINEARIPIYKRVVQTMSTLPHFLSWVIIGGIMIVMLSSHGPINKTVIALGLKPVRFLGDVRIFPWTLILSHVWKGVGFGAVIYLAALAGINPELYEAAAVDGAGRGGQLFHITIPGISPTIILMSCLSLGSILNAGFEQILILLNPIVYATGDIIDTYVYRVGLMRESYSLGTALGLLKSFLGFFLILLSYWLADRFANYRIM